MDSSIGTLLNKKNKKVRHKKKQDRSEKTVKPNGETCAGNQISREICVGKLNIKCTINLKTTICNLDHKVQVESLKSKERIEPQIIVEDKLISTESKPNSFPNIDSKIREKIAIRCFRKSCSMNKQQERKIKKQSTQKIDRSRQLLSPIPLSPLKNDLCDLSYDDISDNSLSLYDKERKKKLKGRRHCKHCRHCSISKESKLDTLIRRAKERERNLVAKSMGMLFLHCKQQSKTTEYSKSNDKPLYELPRYEETNLLTEKNKECTIYSSDMDISIASKSTFVLEGNLPYSPTDITESITDSLNFDYPFSNTNVKSEIMDSEAYSPIHSPDKSECIKVKPEPTSPHHNNNNLDENIFKGFYLDHIKAEVKNE